MVFVWYSELFRALRYQLLWGSELDLSPPKLDPFCIKNSKEKKGVKGIWTHAQKRVLFHWPALYLLSYWRYMCIMVEHKNMFLCKVLNSATVCCQVNWSSAWHNAQAKILNHVIPVELIAFLCITIGAFQVQWCSIEIRHACNI